VSVAVEALKAGASDFVAKPWSNERLAATVRSAAALRRSRIDARTERGRASELVPSSETPLLGESHAMQRVRTLIERAAPTDANVLILGENGTGKEIVAREIHRLSRRSNHPMVAVDLGATSETLFESELFGHVKGAFTGASQSRQGRFKLAGGGTIFLDEIGEMPLSLQGKLLRVLQEREIEPVGGSKTEPVDFRLIAATNKDLEAAVANGTFRSDLFYRLNVVPLVVPALRERRGDVPLLAAHFLARHNSGKERPLRFSADGIEALERHTWPGNVRELENLVERLAVLKGEGEIGVADLPGPIRNARAAPASAEATGNEIPTALPPEGVDLYKVLADLEDRLIREALERSGGNKNRAAKILGLNRTTLVEKLRKKGALKGSSGANG